MNVHHDQHDNPRPFRLVGSEGDAHEIPSEGSAGPPDAEKMAHELSNLLDGSLRNVGLALRRLNNPEQTPTADAQAIERLNDAALSMQDMAALLKRWMSRRGADFVAAFAESDRTLAQAVEHALKTVLPVVRQQGITLDVDMPQPLTDRPAGPLQPVIINGLLNAIEAVESNGRIRLYVESDEQGWLTICICDDGPGVAEHLPRDRDGLVLPGVSTRSNGHGLGLVISRDIIRALGGAIRLENRSCGGAELTLKIPPCGMETTP